jgi:hypothetical protein
MSTLDTTLPADEAGIEELLSRPTPGLLQSLENLPGDIAILGVGGKMGPTLALMARRALDELGRKDRVLGVARFSDPSARSWKHPASKPFAAICWTRRKWRNCRTRPTSSSWPGKSSVHRAGRN